MADEYYTPDSGQKQDTNAAGQNTQQSANTPPDYANNTPPQGSAQQPVQNIPPQQNNTQPPYNNVPPQNGYSQYNMNTRPPYYYPPPYYYYPPQEQKANAGLAVLSWFIPLAGLIIYLTEKDTKPKTAAACGKCALASFIINIVLSLVIYIFIFAVWGVMFTELFDYSVDYMTSAEYVVSNIITAVINLFKN